MQIIKNKFFKKTQLAVGPMNKNCVDTVIKLSKKKKVKIILISSKRQIDSKLFTNSITSFSIINNVFHLYLIV